MCCTVRSDDRSNYLFTLLTFILLIVTADGHDAALMQNYVLLCSSIM